MDRAPAAYIRRSFVDPESPGDIAEAAQLAEVRRLAAADGHNGNLVVYSDWGVSADVAKSAKRTEYTRLLADMEAGRVSAVYAFDADRLYRDPRDLIRLQDAAKRHGVTITTKGGRLPIGDGDDPAGEGFTFITAVFGRMELQKAKKRNRAAMQARRERGDVLGQPGYGWHSARDESGRIIHVPDAERPANAVVDAYREARSIMGAAKLLQRRGVPAPKGGTRWGQSTVTRILEREAPELFPRPSRTGGRRTPTNMMFAQLLACHCGATMTPNRVRNQYYCPWGHRLGSAVHGKITASEAAVREWIEAKVDTMRLPADSIETTERNAARRDAVNARLDRGRELFMAGDIDRKRWEAEKARAAADLDALDATTKVVVKLPDRDRLWTYQPGDINAILREIFVRVDLGPDMLPIGAQPRNPDLFPLIWTARRAKSGDTHRILCGRMVRGEYACPEEIARTHPDRPGIVLLPPGLTDEGMAAGEYGWSRYSEDAIDRGARPRDRRTYQAPVRLGGDLAGTVGRRPSGMRLYRQAVPPVIVPCVRRHSSRIDPDLL